MDVVLVRNLKVGSSYITDRFGMSLFAARDDDKKKGEAKAKEFAKSIGGKIVNTIEK